MSKPVRCCDCGAVITKKDIIAANKKLINIDVREFMCLSCMAEAFECDEEDILMKIEEFKQEGCTLFG